MSAFAGILAFLILLAPAWGQRFFFKDYRQESGLANLVVTAMLQDRNDLLWIGTQNGLYRYDGAKMEPVGRDGSLAGIFVLSLAEASDGTIWVNSHQGLGRIRHGHAEIERSLLEGTEELFLGLAVAANGDVYASAPGGLLLGRRVGREENYAYHWARLNKEQSSRPIRQIAVDDEFRAWFGCGDGLCVARPNGQIDFLRDTQGIVPDEYSGILIDRRGAMYLRSEKRLLRRAPGATRWENFPVPFSLAGPAFLSQGRGRDLMVPHNGGLGIFKSDSRRWFNVREDQGIPGERLSAVLEDHENSLWLGFIGDGAKRWLGYEEWEGYTKRDGLSHDAIWSLLRDEQGVLWSATGAGLNFFDTASNRWRPYGGAEGLAWGQIYNLRAAPGSRIFASVLERGVLELNTKTRTHKLWGKPPRVRRLYFVHIDRRGRFWFGTTEGLFAGASPDPNGWRRSGGSSDGPDVDTIFSVHEDSTGRIWAASNRGVIFSSDANALAWRRLTSRDGLRSNSVWYAKETRPGEYWLGYLESKGASRLQFQSDGQPKWMHVSERQTGQGPPEFVSYFNGIDKAGVHWMGTDRGLFATAPGAARIRHFNDQDGLIWNDCNSNAFYADGDGSVWVGTSRGLAHFTPKRPVFTPALRPRLRRLVLGDRAVESDALAHPQSFVVPAAANALEMEVSALSFRFESRAIYRFRVRGGTERWVGGDSNKVAFANLSPGDNVAEAQVKIDRQPWSESISIPVYVEATFWNTWRGRLLFSLGVAALAVLAIAAVWRYRNQRLLAERASLSQAVQSRTREIESLLKEAQEANKLKSEFLANMSHEIRTPMNGVLGMLQLIEKGQLEQGQREFVGLAKTSAESLLNLLNEILDLSKVESGQVSLELLRFHLGDLARHAAALLEASALDKGLRLEVDISPDAEREVAGDSLRLQQVLLNLIGNGVKFTGSGSVRLAVERLPGGDFRFTVSDDGIGIPPEKQGYIFDAFRQADGSTTRRYGGTGLGLAISQRLVGLMGGEISVESVPGEGSRFRFTLPMATDFPAGTAIDSRTSVPAAPFTAQPALRILVAEDNRVNQIVAARMLEAEGHIVTLVADGAQAAEALRNSRFDLVLMDVHMPVMDGLRATEEIRAWERHSGAAPAKIVALTAGVMNEERARCLLAGMDAFLPKPLTRESLLTALAEALTSSRPLA
jgi:signal transduction histidine kinase/CheY-like chemotaxis protein